MAPSPSPEPILDTARAEHMLDIAQRAIVDFLSDRPLTLPSVTHLHPTLQERVGAFVTLTVGGELQGCIGNVEGDEPLGQAVARLARGDAGRGRRRPRTSGWGGRRREHAARRYADAAESACARPPPVSTVGAASRAAASWAAAAA